MKVVVTSDSHKNTRLLKLIEMIEDADVYLNLGDSEELPEGIRPFISVKGNCDFFDYPISRVVNLENERILMMHGHLMDVRSMVAVAKEKGCNILLYGHTHKYEESFIDSVYVLNPGSVSRPRDGKYPTYMIINIDQDGIKVEKREVNF